MRCAMLASATKRAGATARKNQRAQGRAGGSEYDGAGREHAAAQVAMYRPAVAAQRSRAFSPGKSFASAIGRGGRVHHAQHRHRPAHQPHRYRRAANALEKIAGGIVRIQDPCPAFDGTATFPRGLAGLFADEAAGSARCSAARRRNSISSSMGAFEPAPRGPPGRRNSASSRAPSASTAATVAASTSVSGGISGEITVCASRMRFLLLPACYPERAAQSPEIDACHFAGCGSPACAPATWRGRSAKPAPPLRTASRR